MNARPLVPPDAPPLVAPDWERAGRIEWRRPRALARRWELHVDGEVAAVMTARGVFHRGFLAETAGGRWEILSDWFGVALLRREGERSPLLRFRRTWLGGRVNTGEAEFRWKLGGWWLARSVLSNREGFEFFRIRRRFSPARSQASVELTDSGRRLSGLEPLLLLAWALMISTHHGHGG